MQTFKIAAITATVVFMQAISLTWYFSLDLEGNFAQAFAVPDPVTSAEAYQIADIDSVVIGSVLSPKQIYISDQQISFSKKELDCLARNIYYEAGIESPAGRLAVAQVTHNRLKSGRWGRSVCSVVYAASQFSWTLDPNKRSARPYGPLWRASLQSARDYMAGQRVYGLDRSLHYHADYVSPKWGRDEHRIKQIGAHIFYDLSSPVNVAQTQQ
jgi:spore germination cell wall hydrolase CwlJ-like protein